MKLTFKNGLDVNVRQLHQWNTYQNNEVGYPTWWSNMFKTRLIVDKAQRLCYESAYYVIQPKQSLIEGKKGYLLFKPMKLPTVVCAAELRSYQPIHNQNMHYSSMVLIWFQDTYCLPIDPDIEKRIMKINWRKHAKDDEIT